MLKSLPSPLAAGCYHEAESEHLAAGEEGGAGPLHLRACAQVTTYRTWAASQLSKVRRGGSACLSPNLRGCFSLKSWFSESFWLWLAGSQFPDHRLKQ